MLHTAVSVQLVEGAIVVGNSNAIFPDDRCLICIAIVLETVRFGVFTMVNMKTAMFWDIETQFVLHRRHITSPLQSPVS
jgi:hypothetical protein